MDNEAKVGTLHTPWGMWRLGGCGRAVSVIGSEATVRAATRLEDRILAEDGRMVETLSVTLLLGSPALDEARRLAVSAPPVQRTLARAWLRTHG